YPIAAEAASLSEGNSVVEAVGRWKQREAPAVMRVKVSQLGHVSESTRAIFCGEGSQPKDNSYAASRECAFRDLNSDVPFFVFGDFRTLERTAVNIYHLAEHNSQAEDYALAMDEVSPFIEKWFGHHLEKRGRKAEVIELPDAEGARFESGATLLMAFSDKETAACMAVILQI